MSNKKVKIAVTVLVALVIALVSFGMGFLVERCSSNRTVASYEWAIKTIKDNYYFCDPDETFTETSLSAIAEKYLDRYSEYYTKEEYAEVMKSNQGSKSGIGISYQFKKDEGVYISKVVGNSPAYKSGLQAGDWIRSGSVDGKEVTFTSSENFSDFIAPIKTGEKFSLTSVDGETYSMAKANYTASYTSYSTSTEGWTFSDSLNGGLELCLDIKLKMPFLPDGCAYIRLDQFYGSATDEFFTLIEKFNASNCTSLILDLRSNGGGYVSVMQNIAGAFADGKSTLAMLSRDKKGREEKFYCKKVTDKNKRVDKSVKVFVLANAGTASASEALIGAMHCYGALPYENIFLSQYSDGYVNWLYPTNEGAKNAQTYGKGIMQTPFTNYRTGEVLKLTTAKIFWPDKTTSIHDRGVTLEDGCTAVPTEWEWTKGDKELQSAVEIIKSR
ncbi:MAG: PDZ domain-containing protein [Clostridia bacterium]|nr:PDZ domain-containing protein [Clostridia bacterium]